MKKHVSDIVFLVGLSVICYGVSMINIAAATILGGAFAVFASYTIYRDAKNKGAGK